MRDIKEQVKRAEDETDVQDNGLPDLLSDIFSSDNQSTAEVPPDNETDGSTPETEDDGTIGKEPDPKAAESKLPKTHRAGRIALFAASAVVGTALLVCGTITGLLYHYTEPQTVDLDSTVSFDAVESSPILSALTAFSVPPASIPTDTISDQTLNVTFWGFLNRSVPIAVRDLTPPVVTPYTWTLPVGTLPAPADCIYTCDDKTAVTYAWADDASAIIGKPGESRITVFAEDEGGNRTEISVPVTVLSPEDSVPLSVEFGTKEEQLLTLLAAYAPEMTDIDLTAVDLTATGDYVLVGRIGDQENTRRLCSVSITDTTAPSGRPRSHTFAAEMFADGSVLTPAQFVTEVFDHSEITLSFEKEPDYKTFATQDIVVSAIDAHGNETLFDCQLQLLDIPAQVTLECGTDTETFLASLLAHVPDGDKPRVGASFDASALAPGEHELRLNGKFSALTVNITARDTVAPMLSVKPCTVYLGQTVSAESFVESVVDATAVTLSFASTPDTSAIGSADVTVIATDAAGNKTAMETKMTVIRDTTPPAIYGVHDIYTQENGTVSFRAGVSAIDDADGNIAVRVNADAVDLKKSGTYQIIYTATDKAGNTATKTAKVYVTGINRQSVNLYADNVLAALGTNGMSARDKAAAIYKWCRTNIRYSTSTSDLMGNFVAAAYSGFTTHAGNCYTYYAVCSTLLTRAGIENMEIHRDSIKSPHYWNLVKVDGNWYHLDTCPKLKDYPLQAFLLTDKQVRDYSLYQAKDYYKFDASLYPATP